MTIRKSVLNLLQFWVGYGIIILQTNSNRFVEEINCSINWNCGGCMRLLFEMDKKDYQKCTRTYVRNSARSIIINNHKIAMIHSLKYDYYKFPGGGIEDGENPVDSMIRETQEESGLIVIPETVKEYGYVHRIQKSDNDYTECFIQDNFYFLCQVDNGTVSQNLDDYEAEEAFTLEYVEPIIAINKNSCKNLRPHNRIMLEREARVLELLLSEGFFD